MPSRSARRRLGVLALAAGTALVLPAVAVGAGITLDRVPSPPQAITPGQAEQIQHSISYTSNPISRLLEVRAPTGLVQLSQSTDLTGQPSPANASTAFTPGVGGPVGRYQVSLQFFSNAAGRTIPESTATTIFDVAAALGNLQLIKFEDVNGDGRRDAADSGLPSWNFNLTNPSGNPSSAATGTEGSVLLSNVPAGTWNVAEVPEPGWVPVTPSSGSVLVPAGGTGTFQVGNVRPAPLSGTVWIDQNRNQQIDVGEIGAGGIKLELTGRTGTGQSVTGTTFSAARGTYEFPGLLPGRYQVKVAKPGGFSLTTAQVISNIPITSGTPSPNHNFGIVQGGPPTRITGTPPPDLDIDKRGPATRRRNVPFDFTIRVSNTSRFIARQVVLIDPVPDSMVLVRRPSRARVENGVLRWNLGTIRAGRSKTVRMRVRILPGVPAGRKVNTAIVTAQGVPPETDRAIVRVTDPPRPPRSGGVTG
ncbi:MAG: hypothetical protein OEM67_00235 [Thermoleophilia bacterium]|nr:hypothetical protein [Thermoleophilia bacterium]MDH3724531.1 hypothetical protein [Thermoleophilia bacterium]